MKTTLHAMVLLTLALTGLLVLAGCPKQGQAELQGAPPMTAQQPGTHTMPGGEQMHGTQHPKADADAKETQVSSAETASCPVLGTTMSKDKMTPYEYKGKTYYFCCPPCIDKFKQDPEKYTKNPHDPLPPGQGM